MKNSKDGRGHGPAAWRARCSFRPKPRRIPPPRSSCRARWSWKTAPPNSAAPRRPKPRRLPPGCSKYPASPGSISAMISFPSPRTMLNGSILSRLYWARSWSISCPASRSWATLRFCPKTPMPATSSLTKATNRSC
ncbi:hypothetical protein RHECNPAF_850031 [Rhizobium etli CNPAF512]|nr:hypothetical protein RHECNPAF_850031 [Rhizobium etli CNPAF512]